MTATATELPFRIEDEPPIIPDHTASADDGGYTTEIPPPSSRGRSRARKEPPRTKREREPRPTPRRSRGMFVTPLTQLYTTIGVAILPMDNVCGMAVINAAENCAKTLDELAYQNEAVRKALVAILETSAWGGLIAAHAPILLAVAVHHVPAIRDTLGGLAETIGAVPRQQETPDES